MIDLFLVASCKKGSPAEWELKAEGIISMYHDHAVATIHYNSSKSVKKTFKMVGGKKAFKWDGTHGLRLLLLYQCLNLFC